MLGRKQSLKGEPVLADYGPEESLNESADIEWVNKVNFPFRINYPRQMQMYANLAEHELCFSLSSMLLHRARES